MPQCVSEMVQVSNFYLQRGAAKILNKALLKFGRKPMMWCDEDVMIYYNNDNNTYCWAANAQTFETADHNTV